RRRRRPAPSSRNRSVAGLAAAPDALRRLLARPVQSHHPVRVRLSRQTSKRPGLGDGGTDPPAQREPPQSSERCLLWHAAVTRAVPARHRTLEVPRRPRSARRPDDPPTDRDLDERHRKGQVTFTTLKSQLSTLTANGR